jgi:hypothetical protein
MRSAIHWTPIALLEKTNLLSGMSNGVVTIAIPWLVLQRTGSVTAASALPVTPDGINAEAPEDSGSPDPHADRTHASTAIDTSAVIG